MNLVAKEYVAAQDADDPGVLVLSKFAGAAEQMEEALIVNPYDIDEMAENAKSEPVTIGIYGSGETDSGFRSRSRLRCKSGLARRRFRYR